MLALTTGLDDWPKLLALMIGWYDPVLTRVLPRSACRFGGQAGYGLIVDFDFDAAVFRAAFCGIIWLNRT
jgi:hypothetical protein